MSYIGLRISASVEDKVIEYFNEFMKLNDYDNKVFCVFEHKGQDEEKKLINPHYHFMILDMTYTEAFRKKLYRFFEKKDETYKSKQRGLRMLAGKNYKMKELEKGYLYLCKGRKGVLPDVRINDDLLTQEEIKEYHDRYWNGGECLLKDEDLKNEKKVKQPKQKQLNKVQEFKIYYENECLPRIAERGYKFKYDEIIEDILNFFSNKDMLFRTQLVEQYLNLVFNCYVRQYQIKHFKLFSDRIKENLRYNAYFEEFYKLHD